MRPKSILTLAIGLATLLALVPVATPQDDPFGGLQPHYWPHRAFGIPVNADEIAKLPNKPTHLQLYSSLSRGAFQKGPKLPLNAMHELNGGKRGFLFDAPRDGDYEFAVQFVYTDGSVAPKPEALAPEIRAIIDTTPPRVQLASNGNGVEWRAEDDNLDPRYITLQAKWQNDAAWQPIQDKTLRPSDSYAWKLQPGGRVMEVRVLRATAPGTKAFRR